MRTLCLLGALLFLYLAWGSSYLGNHYAAQTLPPLLLVGSRYGLAGLALFGISQAAGARLPGLRQWGMATITGLLLIALTQWALITAEAGLPSGVVALLFATLPLWTVAAEWILPGGRRPRGGVLIGLAFGLAGIAFLIRENLMAGHGPVNGWAIAVAMLGAVSWSAASIVMQKLKFTDSAVQASGMQMMLGGGALFLLGMLSPERAAFSFHQVSRASAIAFAYLVIIPSTAGYPIYNWLLEEIDPAIVATFAYVNPVVAILLGWLVIGEALTVTTVISTALLVIGVIFITRYQGQTPRRTLADATRDPLGKPVREAV